MKKTDLDIFWVAVSDLHDTGWEIELARLWQSATLKAGLGLHGYDFVWVVKHLPFVYYQEEDSSFWVKEEYRSKL